MLKVLAIMWMNSANDITMRLPLLPHVQKHSRVQIIASVFSFTASAGAFNYTPPENYGNITMSTILIDTYTPSMKFLHVLCLVLLFAHCQIMLA